MRWIASVLAALLLPVAAYAVDGDQVGSTYSKRGDVEVAFLLCDGRDASGANPDDCAVFDTYSKGFNSDEWKVMLDANVGCDTTTSATIKGSYDSAGTFWDFGTLGSAAAVNGYLTFLHSPPRYLKVTLSGTCTSGTVRLVLRSQG